ncbi:phosphogluconate dehydrogenase (NADP(+)-dependent, decarboxylating), partial [Bifidobacterium aemilianum]
MRKEAQEQRLAGPKAEGAFASLAADQEGRRAFIEDIRQALYASKIVAYAQGFNEMEEGAKVYGWQLDLGAIARIWRGGCIIRARFLNRISDAYGSGESFGSLLFDPFFKQAVEGAQDSWRRVVARAAQAGLPAPVFASSLSYYDALRSKRLPAALIQGQRDLFGAHT